MLRAPAPLPSRRLAFDEFYGSRDRRVAFDGFVLSLMRPDPNLDVQFHTHDTAHLILTLSGGYTRSAAFAPTTWKSAALIYNPPGTTHRDRYERKGSLIDGRFLSVGISTETWCAVSSGAPLSGDAEFRCDAATMSLAARLLAAVVVKRPALPIEIESILYELLGRYVAGRKGRDSAAVPSWLDRAVELLRARCAERVSITDVAAVCGVHPVYLARAFRRHMGCTPGQIVREARLERACSLLSSSRAPLSEIALECGFADQSHLTTSFRRATSFPPGHFRTLLQFDRTSA
ncbi:MAG: AraC family transcriptional regulator [Gemmatimonadaceae bacterium]